MKLTVEQVAQRLDLPASTVERWIRQGRIPVYRQGSACEFDTTALERWAATHNLVFRQAGATACRPEDPACNPLLAAMKRGGVHHDIAGPDKKGVLGALLEKEAGLSEAMRASLLEKLLERERLTSTGIGKGVAIPHPRNPLPGSVAEAAIVTGFTSRPVAFDAVDDKPVFVLFLLLCPSVKQHLNLLSRLSFCLRDSGFVQFLKTAPTADALFDRITRFEEQLDNSDTI